MTYNYNIVVSSINLYNLLKNKKIVGIERLNLIIKTFNISISTFYNWYFLYNNLSNHDFKNHFNKRTRKTKINKDIINFIIDTIKNNSFIRIKGIKKKLMKNLIFPYLKQVLESYFIKII